MSTYLLTNVCLLGIGGLDLNGLFAQFILMLKAFSSDGKNVLVTSTLDDGDQPASVQR